MKIQSVQTPRISSLKTPDRSCQPAACQADQFLPNGRSGRPLFPGEMLALLAPPTVAMTATYAVAQSLPPQLQIAAALGGAALGGVAGYALFRSLSKETTQWCRSGLPTLANSLKTNALNGLAFAGLGLAPLLGSNPGHLPSLATAAAFAAGGAAIGFLPGVAIDCCRYLKHRS